MKASRWLILGGLLLLPLIWPRLVRAEEVTDPVKRLSPGNVAWLSLIPGEGQFYNQQPGKGWFFLGLETVNLAGIGLAADTGGREWQAYQLSSGPMEKASHLYNYRQQQFTKRNLIYLYLFLKAAEALDAYVDAHFFAIDHRLPRLSLTYEAGEINLSTVITW